MLKDALNTKFKYKMPFLIEFIFDSWFLVDLRFGCLQAKPKAKTKDKGWISVHPTSILGAPNANFHIYLLPEWLGNKNILKPHPSTLPGPSKMSFFYSLDSNALVLHGLTFEVSFFSFSPRASPVSARTNPPSTNFSAGVVRCWPLASYQPY